MVIADKFNEKGITPREVFMRHIYDLPQKVHSLNKEVEYITTAKFFEVIEADYGIKFENH